MALLLNRFWLPAAVLCCGLVLLACVEALTGGPRNIDFAAFWHAGQVILRGVPEAAYGIGMNPFGDLIPIAYPPPFLAFIAPFGLLSFGAAFTLWVVVTGAFYVAASKSRVALANPAAAFNGLVGQNGFLTTGLLLLGLGLLSANPVAAGVILGFMVVKPQLALALPVVVIAGRLWRAIPAGLASASLLLGLAAVTFGPDTYRGFLENLSLYGEWLSDGRWPWSHIASFYGIGRWFGLGGYAWILHGGVAAAALAAVWVAWRGNWDGKIAIAASASLLLSPYLFAYDAVLLVAPLAYFASRQPLWALAVWSLAALQLLRIFGAYAGPATTPLAAALAIAVITFTESPRTPSREP